MGIIRSFLRATAATYALEGARAKYHKAIAMIDKATAGLYAAADAGFAPFAAHVNIPDAAARVARDPRVIAAAAAVDTLRAALFDALIAPNPNADLTRVAAPAPATINNLFIALRDTYLKVLMPADAVDALRAGVIDIDELGGAAVPAAIRSDFMRVLLSDQDPECAQNGTRLLQF
jgi:hypothetical protein